MKKLGIAVLIIVSALVIAVVWSMRVESPHRESTVQQNSSDANQSESNAFVVEEVELAPSKLSIDDLDSIWLVVNKNRTIDLDYIPEDLRDVQVTKRQDKSAAELMLRDEAATALEAMFKAASSEDIALLMGSAYRSAELQEFYYNNYVNAYGQVEADKFSAKPGTSEHQIGLSADISAESRVCYLEICFEDIPEGQWVAENAHKFGFIIRYPEGKELITGYQYEPWHLRFVGEELAEQLHTSEQTLEEYFNL